MWGVWLSIQFRYHCSVLILSHRILNRKSINHNTPETAGHIGRQLGCFYPSALLGQTLTNFLTISIYMYTKDWKGSHLSNQKCYMDHWLWKGKINIIYNANVFYHPPLNLFLSSGIISSNKSLWRVSMKLWWVLLVEAGSPLALLPWIHCDSNWAFTCPTPARECGGLSGAWVP